MGTGDERVMMHRGTDDPELAKGILRCEFLSSSDYECYQLGTCPQVLVRTVRTGTCPQVSTLGLRQVLVWSYDYFGQTWVRSMAAPGKPLSSTRSPGCCST